MFMYHLVTLLQLDTSLCHSISRLAGFDIPSLSVYKQLVYKVYGETIKESQMEPPHIIETRPRGIKTVFHTITNVVGPVKKNNAYKLYSYTPSENSSPPPARSSGQTTVYRGETLPSVQLWNALSSGFS